MHAALKPYLAALLVMGLLDALWLGLLARDFYRQEITKWKKLSADNNIRVEQ